MLSDSDIQDEELSSSFNLIQSKINTQINTQDSSTLQSNMNQENNQVQFCNTNLKFRKRSEESLKNGKPPIPESFLQCFINPQSENEQLEKPNENKTTFKRINIKDLKLREENIIPDEEEVKKTGKEDVYIDEKGRRCIVGKPRSNDFFSIDVEIPEKKNSKISFKGITEGLKDLLPKSPSIIESSLLVPEEHIVEEIWNTKMREIKTWKEFTLEGVPKENLCLVNQDILKDGYHIEYGEDEPTKDNLLLADSLNNFDHSTEYIPYYSTYLYPVEHNNYIGYDEDSDTYWVISMESKPFSRNSDQVRVLIRSGKSVYRCCIEHNQTCTLIEKDKRPSPKLLSLYKMFPVLEKVKLSRVKTQEICEDLHSMEMKETILGRRYKFGVLYVKPNQTEDEIFANNEMTPDFEEFLEFLGSKITLKGWNRYSGGLDCKTDTTGTHSIFNELNGVEIMFHVGCLLPYNEKDQQRVERKRHIGNDIVVFVFLEEGCEPHDAKKFTSQFIHIQFVIQKVPNEKDTTYRVSVVTKAGVEPHNPILPPIIKKTSENSKLLLTKAINAERTVMFSSEFKSKMNRTRKEFLKHIYDTYKKKK